MSTPSLDNPVSSAAPASLESTVATLAQSVITMRQLMEQQAVDLDAKLESLAKHEITNARNTNKLEDEITSQLVTSTKDILREGLSIGELRFLQGQSNKRYGRRKQSLIRISRMEIREGVRLSDDVIDKL